MFIQVRFDGRRSYEVGLEVGQLTHDPVRVGPPYSLGEILGVGGVALTQRPHFQATTHDGLAAALEAIARLLEQHGTTVLQGDAGAFAALARQRQQDCAAYEAERRLTRMRDAAEKAWQAHDYMTVARLYQLELARLTAAEVKRYEIALNYIERSRRMNR